MAKVDVRKENHRFKYDFSSDYIAVDSDGQVIHKNNYTEIERVLVRVDDVEDFVKAVRAAAALHNIQHPDDEE